MNYEKGLVKKVMRVLLHLWTSLLHLLSHLAKSPPKVVAALLQCNRAFTLLQCNRAFLACHFLTQFCGSAVMSVLPFGS